ncbi:MAG: molybdenum cofactor guanylyltransferase [Gammaproteobacteria bacterium]|nr:molybdenum cofactor guanylyltransferase [Gammaproteobacteria bacterium]
MTGVILAGGEARRMGGGDKGLVPLAGRPMIEYVLDVLRPQVSGVLINANRNLETYARLGCPVIADEFPGFNGPLAGMASALRAVRTPYLATVPCDSPFVPADLVARLAAALEQAGADICVAHNGERMQPVFSLMRSNLIDSLLLFLKRGGRKIDQWHAGHRTAIADFSDKPETFMNVNTPDELRSIELAMAKPSHARAGSQS